MDTQLHKVADLCGDAPSQQSGIIRPQHLLVPGIRSARAADTGIDQGSFKFLRGQVELHRVHAGFGKDHGGQHRAQLTTQRQRVVVLSFVIGGYDHFGEPLGKSGGFEKRIPELLGRSLRIVENQPPPGEEIAIEVVEVISLQADIDVASVRIPGVVGVLPLPPLVLLVEFLGNVPLAYGRVESVEHNSGTLGHKTRLRFLLHPQTGTVVELPCYWLGTQHSQTNQQKTEEYPAL